MRAQWPQRGLRYGVAISLFIAILQFSVSAQLPTQTAQPQPSQSPATDNSADPLGRTSPRGTVVGFLTSAYNQKYEIAAQYLDTHTRGKDAANLAHELFYVLDRRLPAKLNDISNDPNGSMSNAADSRRELIGSVVTVNGGVDIYLERIDRPNATPIWLFARDTLVGIPDVYTEITSDHSVQDRLPDFLLSRFFGVTLFGWCFFFIFLPLEYLSLSLINRLVGAATGYAIRRLTHRPEMQNPTVLPHPARLLIISWSITLTLHRSGLSLLGRQTASLTATLLLVAALCWTMFLINARCEVVFKRRLESSGRVSFIAVLRPARRMMDLIAIVAGVIFLLHALGINPTATLAGLGVGGIAVALAAQKTLENLIGGASLIMDGAVRVGDFFKIGDVSGTIEVIGLRSTRVRTLDRTVVTIPNGQMATMTLENMSARDQFWFRHVINVEIATTPDALKAILENVRALLERDSRVVPGSTRVRFLSIAESCLQLEAFAYISARDWGHFLEIQEDLLIKIRQLTASAGVELAYPSRAIYLKSEVQNNGAPLQPPFQELVSDKEADHEMHAQY